MPLIGALVVKEFQTWLRDRGTFAAFSLLVLVSSMLVLVLSVVALVPQANAAPALFATGLTTSTSLDPLVTHRGLLIFGGVGLCLVLAAVVVAPTVAASAFASERERGTLDLLLLQGPGSLHTVVAKVIAALGFSLLILLVAVPFFAPAWAFGGVDPTAIVALAATLVALTFFCTAVGVFIAALVRGVLLAAAFAQAAGLLLALGTLGAASLFITSNTLGPVVVAFQRVNPIVAIFSIGGPTSRTILRSAPVLLRRLLSMGSPNAASSAAGLPDWVVASLIWIVAGVCLVVAASIALDPCHPMRVNWRWRAT